MGMQTMQVQQPSTPSVGKGSPFMSQQANPFGPPSPAPMGKGGAQTPIGKAPESRIGQLTMLGQSMQPQMGQPNRYSNTVGSWDNLTIGGKVPETFKPQMGNSAFGKGGEGSPPANPATNYQRAGVNYDPAMQQQDYLVRQRMEDFQY